MSTETNRAVARRYWDEIWDRGALAVADEIFAPACVLQMPPPNRSLEGPDAIKAFVTTDRGAYADLRFTVDAMVAEGDWVFVHWTMRGTHAGTWHNIPATGKTVEFVGVTGFLFGGG